MRKILFGFFALALVAAPVFAGKYNKVVSVGEQAPTFAGIPAVYNGEDTSLTLSDIKEDVVVLVFLGNHCPVVVAYEDRLIEFTKAYKDKNVRVVGVAVGDIEGDKIPGIKEYTKDHGSNYIYGYDESQAIGKAYGATNTPQFFVLDKARKIRYTGAMDDNTKESGVTKHYLSDAVDALLKGETPAVTETRPVGCGVRYKKS
jgi:thiol-disulfide isomerase/thioredoxin